MADGMHQVGLAEPGAPVEIEGIVDVPGGFRHRKGGGMGEFVAAADHESIELVFRDQVGGVVARAVILKLLLGLRLQDELYIIVMFEHLRDGHLEEAGVPGGDVIDHMGLFGRDDDAYHIIYHVQVFQGLHPCLIRDVSEFIFPFNAFLDGRPTAFDIVHCCSSFLKKPHCNLYLTSGESCRRNFPYTL